MATSISQLPTEEQDKLYVTMATEKPPAGSPEAVEEEFDILEAENKALKTQLEAAEGQAKFCEEEMDVLQGKLDILTAENEALNKELMKQPKHPAEVNQEEMLAILSGVWFGTYHSSGHVTNKHDQGVVCQFRRDGETVHLNLKVPQVFVLDQFVPKKDKE